MAKAAFVQVSQGPIGQLLDCGSQSQPPFFLLARVPVFVQHARARLLNKGRSDDPAQLNQWQTLTAWAMANP
jgi:hypothetical protein